jgi:3-deoxy-D-manno-octulosonic acid kinase
MINAQVLSTATGAIVFDAALGTVPGPEWFDPAHWRPLGQASAGRGGVVFVDTPAGACALRHYHRGGLAARVSADRYVWTGGERTRAFREFRLLATLSDRGLPVPAPVAARYQREGIAYRADLLTHRIASSRTLAACMTERTLDAELAEDVGATLARFHAANVWHADLNAHNILVDENDVIWLVDFDRGRLRSPDVGWRRANIARLRRSFDKLGARRYEAFDTRFWEPLLDAYRDSFRTALTQEARS